jgi:hypothetical protein
VRANDGTLWSPWSQAFTVSPGANTAPVVSIANMNVTMSQDQTVAASTLFTASDPDGDSIAQYDFWDTGEGGGHWVVNGVAQTGGHDIFVAASQMAHMSYVAGSSTDTLWVRVNDGTLWSPWSQAFTVSPGANAAPVVSIANTNVTMSQGQTVAASALFTASDPDGTSIAQYDFWDTGEGGGHFVVNGVAQIGGHDIFVAASQLAQVSYVAGSSADTLWVRVNDGALWSPWSQAFTVKPPSAVQANAEGAAGSAAALNLAGSDTFQFIYDFVQQTASAAQTAAGASDADHSSSAALLAQIADWHSDGQIVADAHGADIAASILNQHQTDFHLV